MNQKNVRALNAAVSEAIKFLRDVLVHTKDGHLASDTMKIKIEAASILLEASTMCAEDEDKEEDEEGEEWKRDKEEEY